MSARRPAVGSFLCIPLSDGSFGYGRVLQNPYIAFYKLRTREPSSDIATIGQASLLFTQAVRYGKQWSVMGQSPLEGEVAKPVVCFMQDLADYRKCTIFDSIGMEKKVSPEACIGIERASVWDAHHIEERLLDEFLGRQSSIALHERVKLSNEKR